MTLAGNTQGILAAAALFAAASPARAQALLDRGPPAQRVVHRSLVAVRGNPLGLFYDGRLSYRLRLYRDDGLALRDNFAGVGVAATLTPSFARIGPLLEVAPASFATVWTSLQYSRYFGGFGQLQSFPSPRSDFSDGELERRADLPDGDPDKNYGASGLELTLGLDLQARIGPAAVRSQTRLMRVDLDLREGDTVFYDQANDLLAPDGGWSVVTDLDAVQLGLRGRLALGLRYTASFPLYDDGDYATGEPRESDNASHRFGPVAAYSFYTTDGRALNAPTILLLVQWWLDHRYRTGAESSQSLPLIALGFRVHGDLLPLDR